MIDIFQSSVVHHWRLVEKIYTSALHYENITKRYEIMECYFKRHELMAYYYKEVRVCGMSPETHYK